MKINRNSWHFKFLFSDDWWELSPHKYQTLCSYNWAIISRAVLTVFCMLVILVLSFLFGLLLIGIPLAWIYNCITMGFYMSFDMLGLIIDAILGGAFLTFWLQETTSPSIQTFVQNVGHKVDEIRDNVRESWVAKTWRDFNEKHCTLLEFVDR